MIAAKIPVRPTAGAGRLQAHAAPPKWIIDRVRGAEFESLYAEHAEPLLAFLAYRTGDRRLAEDLAADTFERVLRTRSRLDRRKSSAKTWIYTIALNLLRDHLRRDAARRRTLDLTPAPEPDSAPFDRIETRATVQQALTTLNDDEREAVALRFGADLTFPEIAKVLGCPVSTAEGRTHRAVAKLREVLERDEPSSGRVSARGSA
jgi:RNA polymerase sigma factor (sigma-70 family)